MKRTIASQQELEALHQELVSRQQRYAEKAWSLTDAFFTLCGDLFQESVLDALTREETIQFIASLALVCRQWYQWVRQVKHLRFGINNWSTGIYDHILSQYFQQVNEVTSHFKILEGGYHKSEVAYARIKSLYILPVGPYESTDTKLKLTYWTSLTTLILHDVSIQVKGLCELTSLTKLIVMGAAFKDINQITKLSNLSHLAISQSARDAPISKLKSLEYLASDHPNHFVDYSGRGLLHAWIYSLLYHGDDDSEEEDEKIKDDFAIFGADTFACQLKGYWNQGRFTGDGWVNFDDASYCQYNGSFVNNMRHGAGQESNYKTQSLYVGEWRHGVRHQGKLYRTETGGEYYVKDRHRRTLID